MFALWCSLLLGLSATVHARPAAWPTPLDRLPLFSRDGTTALSATQLGSFAPFTQFARAAYCPSDKIMSWQCGGAVQLGTSPTSALTVHQRLAMLIRGSTPPSLVVMAMGCNSVGVHVVGKKVLD